MKVLADIAAWNENGPTVIPEGTECTLDGVAGPGTAQGIILADGSRYRVGPAQALAIR